ncbi:MAG: NAD-dependent succinate-semialdehyde dehydrogenase [Cytophagaceae bacterium]|nr:NAD-dependent succinate-semialdehyde dehydrogenase [Cytophagaceae bacterium]
MPKLQSINPYNNQLIAEYEEFDEKKLNQILNESANTFLSWKKTSFAERAKVMKKCAEDLLESKASLAELIVKEMGKPITQAIAEIEKCAICCEYYADNAKSFLKDEIITSDASKSFVTYEPLGTVLAIMPWNFPFWQTFRFAAPALMAGNTAVLKHAFNVSGCSLAIEKVFLDAGFPEYAFKSLIIGSAKVKYVIEHPSIKAVTLTGSEFAGSEVAMTAGKNIKKTVLELGGSDPFIICKDADLEEASEMAVRSRMINTGQSCIAAKRFIIVQEVYEKFLDLMKTKMTLLKIGDPMDAKTDLGPLAREDLVSGLLKQVEQTVSKGGKIFFGGGRPEREGAFMNPTMLIDLKPGMAAYEEELFGPVASVFEAKDEQDAIRIANDSKYGLGAAIWTKDIERGIALGKQIESGAVFINGIVKSDPRLPFGGIKTSGYGRELSYVGIREFVNVKSVWVK